MPYEAGHAGAVETDPKLFKAALVHTLHQRVEGVVIVLDLDSGLSGRARVTLPTYWTTRLRREIGKAGTRCRGAIGR